MQDLDSGQFLFSVGNFCSAINKISKSFTEAKYLLEFKSYTAEEGVIWYDDEYFSSKENYCLPQEKQVQLINRPYRAKLPRLEIF
jgi:hypothetical protein